MKLSEPQSDYVERIGRWWELATGSRTAGRILGWLMICEPPHQSSGDLVDALGVSAGSVSTQIRHLERVGLVERITFPGNRAAYYQLRPHAWLEQVWAERKARLDEMVDLAGAADEVLPSIRPERVTDLGRIAEFFAAEWPDLMERLTVYLEKERVK